MSQGTSFNGVSYNSAMSKENYFDYDKQSNNTTIANNGIVKGEMRSSGVSKGGGVLGKGSLAEEYKLIQKRMDDRLTKEIHNNAIAHATTQSTTTFQGKSISFENYGGSIGGKTFEKDSKQSNTRKQQPLVSNDAYINTDDSKGYKFFRSQRSVAMRIKDNYESQLNNMETDKLSLIQKLNDSLVQLDKLNQEKAQMSNQLIELLKFVRDMQRETSKGDDLNAVVNDELKIELRELKEQSHHLREELKLAEIERLRILQRLQELSQETSEGEIVQSDMNVVLVTKTRSLIDLQVEHKEVLERIKRIEEEIDNLRAVTIATQEQIKLLKNKLEEVVDDKRSFHSKITVLQDRFDATIFNYQKEKHDTHNMQSRHIKLISGKFLFELLRDILLKNMQSNFDSLRYETTKRYRNKRGLIRMRKTLKNNRQNRLKHYLNLWFTQALKPIKCRKQKLLIAERMPIKNPLSFAFYKWQNAFQQSRSKTHQKRQIILGMLTSKNNFHLRVIKNYWTRWRDYVRIDEDAKKKTVYKLQVVKHRNYLRKYFARWREISQELDYQIQMNGLGQRLGYRKYMGVIFSNWRLETTDLKSKRLSVLNRYWKNFKIHSLTNKQMRAQTWCILREEKRRSEILLKSCFDAMRQHKEEEKLLKLNTQLQSVELPTQEKAIKVIEEVSSVNSIRQKQMAMKAISKCFGKQLQEYFTKWKSFTITKVYLLNNDIKQRIIKVYLQQLRNAFSKWIEYKGSVMIQFQSEIIQEQEDQIKDCTNKIVQANQDLEERKQRQQSLSSKQIRKILNTAYQKRLSEAINKWKENLQAKDVVTNQIEKVIAKLNRRQKRQSFKRFSEKIKEIKLEEFYNRKVEDHRLKQNEKIKRAHFMTIKNFSQGFIRAKNYMRRLLARLDITLKSNSFKKWFKYQQYKTEKILQQKQNEKVNQIKSLVEVIGTQSDQLQSLLQTNQDQKKMLLNNGRRILMIAFQRQIESSMSQAFSQWKTIARQAKQKESLMKKVLIHIMMNTTEQAFSRWQSFNKKVSIQFFEESIVQEDRQIQLISNEMNKNYSRFSNNRDQGGQVMDDVKRNQLLLAQKYEKTLQALIGKVNKNVVISKQKHIFLNWRLFVQQRKQSVQQLENALNKALIKKGFKSIQKQAKANQTYENKVDRTSQLFRIFWKIKARQALSQWRLNVQSEINKIKNEYLNETQKTLKKHSQVVALIQNRIQDQLVESRNYLKTFDCFVAWKLFIQQKILMKKKISSYQSQQIERQKSSAIFKWHQRVITTHKFKHVKTKVYRVYNSDLLKSVFQSWLLQKRANKNFYQTLSSLASLFDKIYIQRAFRHLALETEAKTYVDLTSKIRASRTLYDKLNFLVMKKQSNIFTELRKHDIQQQKLYLGQQAIIKYHFISKIRAYFREWKSESQRRTLVKDMNEEGPIAIEKYQLRSTLLNLKQMALDDGIETSQLEKVLIDSKAKNMNKIEKTVCRMVCHGDKQLKVLPMCIDQWKQWVHQRKMFRYWLAYINNRADPIRQDLQQAFRKWRSQKQKRQKELQSLQKTQLLKIASTLNTKFQNLSRDLEIADYATEELCEQRDILVQRYVGSQRLAFALVNSNSDRAQQKALSQWMGVTAQDIQERYEQALKDNLNKIAALKDRIKYLEKSNHDLADQNEELRLGALDGIEMAKSIEDLTREREKMSVDLADKAITIRKLLEDNNNLSIRLSNAQEEAQNLIMVSQMRLGQSSQVRYDEY